jgi:hypothetical protein
MFVIVVIGDGGGVEDVVGPFDYDSDARDWAHGTSGEDRFDHWFSWELTTPTDDDGEC